MKRVRSIIIITILAGLISCEKPKTTYSFKNNTSSTIYDFLTFCWNGDDYANEVDHGTLEINEETQRIETSRREIYFSFSFDPGGILYVGSNPYSISLNTHNGFTINDNTQIYGGTTYYVYNSSSVTLYDVYSYYWSGYNSFDIVYHGDIYSGYRTEHVRTDRSYIYIDFALTNGGNCYYVDDPFYISSNTINSLVITDYIDFYACETEGPAFKSTNVDISAERKKYKLIDLLNEIED